jgi:hypothetical protein
MARLLWGMVEQADNPFDPIIATAHCCQSFPYLERFAAWKAQGVGLIASGPLALGDGVPGRLYQSALGWVDQVEPIMQASGTGCRPKYLGSAFAPGSATGDRKPQATAAHPAPASSAGHAQRAATSMAAKVTPLLSHTGIVCVVACAIAWETDANTSHGTATKTARLIDVLMLSMYPALTHHGDNQSAGFSVRYGAWRYQPSAHSWPSRCGGQRFASWRR